MLPQLCIDLLSSPRKVYSHSLGSKKTTLDEAGSAAGENSLAMDAAALDDVWCPSCVPPDISGEFEKGQMIEGSILGEAAILEAALGFGTRVAWVSC
jgi:hypothetical protein